MGRLVDLSIPPGFYRPATRRDARGRWYGGTLVRWFEGILQAMDGWTILQKEGGDVVLDGPGRGIHAWRGNNGSPQLAMGTSEKLWHYAGSVLTDITPLDLSIGSDDAGYSTGLYGRGPYGRGLYGSGSTSVSELVESQSWQMDNFGEDLVAVPYSDSRIFYYDLDVGGHATAIDGAPHARGVVVTEEGFIMALGSSDLDDITLDGAQVRWSDGTNTTVWEPTLSNQAGAHKLRCKGQLLAGKRGGGQQVYLWTDYEFFTAQFVGGTYIYRFDKRGEGCGAISRRGMVVADGKAYWMGSRSFFRYDGFVQPLPSEVSDYVFQDLNTGQAPKIAAGVNSEFGEVIWFYCSAASDEVDRYVVYNYRANVWYFGELKRSSWVDSGAFPTPIAVGPSGTVYKHDTGSVYANDTDGWDPLVPYVLSGPVSLSDHQLMRVQRLIPDEQSLGDVDLSLTVSASPTGAETTYGPYAIYQPTPVRVEARYVSVKLTQVNAGWRFGTLQVELTPGGRR